MSEAKTPKLNLFISLPDHYDLLEMVCPEIKFSADTMIKLDYSFEDLANKENYGIRQFMPTTQTSD